MAVSLLHRSVFVIELLSAVESELVVSPSTAGGNAPGRMTDYGVPLANQQMLSVPLHGTVVAQLMDRPVIPVMYTIRPLEELPDTTASVTAVRPVTVIVPDVAAAAGVTVPDLIVKP